MNRIANFSARFPWLVLIVLALVTFGAFKAITAYLYMEPDLTKFLPKEMVTIKSDDYYRQNYNHQDYALVGVGVDRDMYGNVWNPKVMRFMEKVVEDFKTARATKTFQSKLTGKEETLTQPIGLDVEEINSIANLEDTILDKDTNALRTGRINRSIKEKLGIASKPGFEDNLPESDEELARMIPVLREHVMADSLFNGVIVSRDELGAMIQVPMQRKWDYMRRYARDEIGTAISEERLTARFKGETRDFPFNIWGKEIDGITVNEAYVAEHVAKMRKDAHEFMFDYYQAAYEQYPQLKEVLSQEMTPESFEAAMTILDDKELYQIPQMDIWETSTNDLWAWTLKNMDPFSRENLEFQVFQPRQFAEVAQVASTLQRIMDENKTDGIHTYITGYEYLIAQLSVMMGKDMMRLLPLAVLVDMLILFIAFRSIRGVLIPELVVILAVLWALAAMGLSGVPMSITTFNMPIILLAVGTAYGIHVLNRYYEDIHVPGGRRGIIRSVYSHVGLAVFMAGVTTVAGFASFAVALPGQTLLRLISHFGVFTAVGTFAAIVLAYVMMPALLAIWPSPVETHARRTRIHEGSQGRKIMWTVIAFAPTIVIVALTLSRFPIAALMGPLLTLGLLVATVLFIALYKAVWFTKEIWRGPAPLKEPFSLEAIHEQGTLLDKVFNVFGHTVIKHWKPGLVVTGVVAVVCLFLSYGNYFESGIIYNFKDETQIYQSDKFINQNLSGSYSVSMLFRFRPEVQFNSQEIKDDLKQRTTRFNEAWRAFAQTDPALQFGAFDAMLSRFGDTVGAEKPETSVLQGFLMTIRDTLNEEFRVSGDSTAAGGSPQSAAMAATAADSGGGGLDDLDSLDSMLESPGAGGNGAGDATKAGMADIRTRMQVPDAQAERTNQFIRAVRGNKGTSKGLEMQRAFNELNDIFAVDVKQPVVLHKIEQLEEYAYSLRDRKVDVYGTQMGAIGFVISPLNVIKKIYRVLYFDGDYAYDKLPEPQKDGLPDPVATERSVLGTVVNQAMSSDRDAFNRVILTELDQFLFTVLTRAGETRIVTPLAEDLERKTRELFPPDDPYIGKVTIAGRSPRSMEVTRAIADSQGINLGSAIVMVGLLCMLMFRSVQGGIYAMIPLFLTVLVNFAVIRLAGFAITVSVMIVASIAIGTGVDYTLHFLERFKIQIAKGDDYQKAYLTTLHTSGKAIFFNAIGVALGFSVLLASQFKGNIQMGLLMVGTMLVSSMAALTTLPALIFWLKPQFVHKGKLIEPAE